MREGGVGSNPSQVTQRWKLQFLDMQEVEAFLYFSK